MTGRQLLQLPCYGWVTQGPNELSAVPDPPPTFLRERPNRPALPCCCPRVGVLVNLEFGLLLPATGPLRTVLRWAAAAGLVGGTHASLLSLSETATWHAKRRATPGAGSYTPPTMGNFPRDAAPAAHAPREPPWPVVACRRAAAAALRPPLTSDLRRARNSTSALSAERTCRLTREPSMTSRRIV